MYSDGSERSVQPKWKQLYPWIAYNFNKDVVICSYCAEAEKQNYFGLSRNREPAFISKRFSNWKKALEKFQIHDEESDCHNEAKQMKILAATSEPIDEQSNSKLADQKRNNRKILKF